MQGFRHYSWVVRTFEIFYLIHGETLTIDGLMHAASTCPLLRRIDVEILDEDQERFSRADLRKFKKQYPAVKLIEVCY